MSAMIHTLSASPWVHRICWALLHSLWEGLAVLLALLMVRGLMHGSSATARHAVALLALLMLAACPVVTFFSLAEEQPMTLQVREPVEAQVMKIIPQPVVASSPAVKTNPSPTSAAMPMMPHRRWHLHWEFWVVSAWLGGLGLLSLRHAVGWLLLQRLRHIGVTVLAPAMEEMVAKVRAMLGIRGRVIVRWSDRLHCPATFGWWRPVILLPLSMTSGLSAQQWEMILLHEMAHLRRHDYLINLMQTAVETLMFYHPAMWWISRQIRREREHACDDAAVNLSQDQVAYARALTKLAEMELSLPGLALGVAAPRSELYRRIARLLRPAPCSFALGPLLGGAATALLIGGIIFAATTHPSFAQSKDKAAAVNAEPIRGDIRDRNGVVLATSDRPDRQILFKVADLVRAWTATHGENLPTYQYHHKDKDEDREIAKIDFARMLDEVVTPSLKGHGLDQPLSLESLRADAESVRRDKDGRIQPPDFVLFYRRWLSEEEFKRAESVKASIPGMITRVVKFRHYPLEAVGAHALGYVGYDKRGDAVNRGLDTTKGRSGAESAWDVQLKAKAQNGKSVKRGDDLYLTLDARHQMIVEQTLRDAGVGRGAAVLLDATSGDVLAMASAPSFDPNDFIPSISREKFEAYLNDKSMPLINRAIAGQYVPGSAFLPVTSLAAVCAGHENDTNTCAGAFSINGRDFKCWIGLTGGGHGDMTLSEAIEHSCNVFFYKLGIATGADQMEATGQLLGLGRKTGIGLPEEQDGVMPGPKWLTTRQAQDRGLRWTDGTTANTAIGQGYVLTTPLQMAGVMRTIANDGRVSHPRLLDKVVSSTDQATVVQPKVRGADLHEHGLTKSGLEMIRKGLHDSVHSGKSSARNAASEQISIAGHTGTSQYWTGPQGAKENRAIFVCYAPADKPKWALAVFVEGGKSGGGVAAPIAKRILEQVSAVESGQLKVEIKPLSPIKGHFEPIETVGFADGGE